MAHQDILSILLVAVGIAEVLALSVLLLAPRLADWWNALLTLAEDGWCAFHDRFLLSASERQIAQIHAAGEAARQEMYHLYQEYLRVVLCQPKGR